MIYVAIRVETVFFNFMNKSPLFENVGNWNIERQVIFETLLLQTQNVPIIFGQKLFLVITIGNNLLLDC